MIDNNCEVSDRETEFRTLDKSRLVYVGDHRVYRVFKQADTGDFWVTCMGDFVSHHLDNPLPRG